MLISYINMFCSAVSVTAPSWEGVPLGQCELVTRCMARMDRMRPSNPAYETTWDLNVLIGWIKTLRPNEQLDIQTLRLKCIVLFKLVDLARSADILSVSHQLIAFTQNGMTGTRRPFKNYTQDRPLTFQVSKSSNKNLCVVEA